MVTKIPGIALGISTADCGPVLFADAQAGVIGAAHAGWRGALSGVLEATVAAMEELGADRKRTTAALGPMIRQSNYEVGPEFVARFLDANESNAAFFAPSERKHHAMFDLAGYAAMRLARAGIGTIEDLELCTYAEPERFFSYRRMTKLGETDYGRHINAIVLTE
jgi:YfiH family protein